MARPSRYPPELRERAVRMVLESKADYGSEYEAIRSISAKLGITSPESLRKWVRQVEVDGGVRQGKTTQIGYVDEVVEPDVLMERAIEYAERLARRVKRAVEAVKRSAYIGGSMTLEHGLHLERAEFLSCIGQPGAQEAMGAYIAQSDASGDLLAYDNHTYLRMREGGSLQ